MSATPNNTGAAWSTPPLGPPQADMGDGGGRDALQALLAFACLREQAARNREKDSRKALIPKDEEFALDEVLRLVAARAISITGADGVAIAIAEENAIICRASAGRIAPPSGIRLDPASGFSGACLRSGQTIRCDDSDSDTRVNAQACRDLGTRSMIAVPLSARQRVAGLIEAFSKEPYGFNDSDVRSLNLLGELILAAIRPEEEDRLAQLAELVLPAPPSSPAPSELKAEPALVLSPTPQESRAEPAVTPLEAPAPVTTHEVQPAKVIVDQEFVPVPVADKPEPAKFISIPALPEPKLDLRAAPVEAPGSRPREERKFPGILLTAALVLIVIGLGWAVVWKARHAEQSMKASTRVPRVPVKAATPDFGEADSIPVPEAKSTATPQVTGIRHWSSAESSTVVVDLDDAVQYEAHSIENPARIYLDLSDTRMGPGLLNQSIAIDDAFLKRVRMAQPRKGVTRVVLETKGNLEPSVKLDSNPAHLTIEVHKIGTQAMPNLNKPSPATAVMPKKKASSGGPVLSSTEMRIVLDAGHGGWDLGTVGKKGLLEKDLVLDIVQKLGQMLQEKLGADVIYTRQDDSYLALEKRAEIANVAGADLFLSVHANYSDLETARGVETYYTQTYSSVKARTTDDLAALKEVNWTGVDIREKVTGSHRFAADVQQALYRGLVSQNPDIRNRGVKEAQYVVLTGTQMPAVLAEVSFVSSPADESKLQSSEYRKQIAGALFKGIARYQDETKRTKVASAKN